MGTYGVLAMNRKSPAVADVQPARSRSPLCVSGSTRDRGKGAAVDTRDGPSTLHVPAAVPRAVRVSPVPMKPATVSSGGLSRYVSVCSTVVYLKMYFQLIG
jgi:hypothetical protein